MIAEPAVRPLRAAVIAALKSLVPAVDGRVYTIPLPQDDQGQPPGFPYITVGGYTEGPDAHAMAGRHGSEVRFDIRIFHRNAPGQFGDAGVLGLYEGAYQALNRQALSVDAHLHLWGTLRLTAGPVADPDGKTTWIVARYEAETKVSG